MYNIFSASTKRWDILKKHAIKIIVEIQKMAKAVEITDYYFTRYAILLCVAEHRENG